MASRLLRTATGRFARHACVRFLGFAAITFVGLEVFVAVAALLRFLVAHPYVPLTLLVARLPDVLLDLLPVSLPFVVLLALVATTEEIRTRRMFLRAGMVGAPTLLLFAPVLACVALLCTGTLYLHGSVLPHVRFELDHFAEQAPVSTDLLAIRLAEDPGFVSGLRIRFDGLDEGRMENVRMTTTAVAAPMAIVARTAAVRRVPESRFLELTLSDGRLVRLDQDLSIEQNARFETLRIRRDVRSLGGGEKTDLIALSYYSDAELDRLHGLYVHRLQRGVRATRKQIRLLRGVAGERWVRRQAAWLPFLVALLVVVALAEPLLHRPRGTVAVVVFVSLGGLVPAQLLLESAAQRGRLDPVWLACTPSLLTVATLAILVCVRRRGVRRA